MKKLVLFIVVCLAGSFAQANDDMVGVENLGAWTCHLGFKGTSKGLKVIVGKFKTVAYGTLKCKGIKDSYRQKVRVTIGHHWIGPVVGVGHVKMKGVSSEISLFNGSPEMILGKYLVAQGEAAIVGGVGAFTAVKVGLPQLAFNVSVQLLHGVGVQLGIDKLKIEAVY